MHAQNSVTQSNESLYVDDYNSEDYNNNNNKGVNDDSRQHKINWHQWQ